MIYVFDDCELDTQRCELRRGGRPFHVEPQVFDVLAYLVANADRLVTKEELFDSVWGHRYITPATLNSRLRFVRQAIGDDGAAQRVIRTVRGRGFRFLLPVVVRGAEISASPGEAVTVHERTSDVTAEEGAAEFGIQSRVRPMEPQAVVAAPNTFPTPPQPQPDLADSDDAARSRMTDSVREGHESDDRNGATAPGPSRASIPLVARGPELSRLRQLLDDARAGNRQIAFLTGEPGIGKSTLAEALLGDLPDDVAVARGQCLEQHGAGEPYLPLLDALGRLCRGPNGAEMVGILDASAPTWLGQLPAVVGAEPAEAATRRAFGATRERMLRELVDALERFTRRRPLVLLLEDLHWSDPSTLDLIAWLSLRNETARLLLLVTFRPEDSPLELRSVRVQAARSGRLTELPLGRWTEAETLAYCAARMNGASPPPALVRIARERGGGNPLFVQLLVDAWLEGAAAGDGIDPLETSAMGSDLLPESLTSIIEDRLERLSSNEQRMLEAASVVGSSFAVSLVASALAMDEEEVETSLGKIGRTGRVIREAGQEEWPDGTYTARFEFAHHLFQEVLYGRVAVTRRARLHRAIAERMEMGFGVDTAERSAELAHHFRSGREERRALPYIRRSAEQALRRSAHREGLDYLRAALAVLHRNPDLPDAARTELQLQRMLAPTLLLTRGWGDVEAERAYLRAREISELLDDPHELVRALHGMAYVHEIRGDFHQSQALLEQVLELRGSAPGPYTSVEASELMSCSLFHQGKFDHALASARSVIGALQPMERGDPFAASLGMNASLASHYWAGFALWCMGMVDQALEPIRDALRIAQDSQLIYMQAASYGQAAQLFQFRRELDPLVENAEAALRISDRQGYPFHHSIALTLLGWAAVVREGSDSGIDRIRRGIQMQAAAGADIERPYGLALLADALLMADRAPEGIAAAQEALTIIDRRARAFFWEAEIHRLLGELRIRTGDADRGAADLEKALHIARHQGARSLELRAALSIARHAERTGRGDSAAARRTLVTLLGGFTEGFDTADLQEARTYLQSVGGLEVQLGPMPVISE
jgi:DNA-binding winged helix-turn-helix (wHTH) protein/tetratricopeptide (TPR) repeat protein